MYRKYDELQNQIDDSLYEAINGYCFANGISLEKFAEMAHTSFYIFQKAFDRKIKMHVHDTLIINIKKALGIYENDEK